MESLSSEEKQKTYTWAAQYTENVLLQKHNRLERIVVYDILSTAHTNVRCSRVQLCSSQLLQQFSIYAFVCNKTMFVKYKNICYIRFCSDKGNSCEAADLNAVN